jgi:hypothetical protein
LKHALYSINDIEIARDYSLMKFQGDGYERTNERVEIGRFDYPMSSVQTPKGIVTKHSASLPSML